VLDVGGHGRERIVPRILSRETRIAKSAWWSTAAEG
jgi:hypothetical protein